MTATAVTGLGPSASSHPEGALGPRGDGAVSRRPTHVLVQNQHKPSVPAAMAAGAQGCTPGLRLSLPCWHPNPTPNWSRTPLPLPLCHPVPHTFAPVSSWSQAPASPSCPPGPWVQVSWASVRSAPPLKPRAGLACRGSGTGEHRSSAFAPIPAPTTGHTHSFPDVWGIFLLTEAEAVG